MAQALLANSPLQSEVVSLMDRSELTPFYKQLVNNGQGGGLNNLTIKESEMAYYRHKHEHALNDLAADALMNEDPTETGSTHKWYPAPTIAPSSYTMNWRYQRPMNC
ncbi:MAG: hypothetical protein IPP33_11565 [Flavobacteriales bacterium]|nr:hypothetical protein [Flavobacteriales bacterium]